MNQYKRSLLILLLFSSSLLRAQNLVPNGSFEIFSSCPSNYGQIYKATGWFQPHKYPGNNNVNSCSSSDLFQSCALLPNLSVPLNDAGFQNARTGNAYAGIAFFTIWVNGNGGREYIEVKLNKALVENKKYDLTYYVSFAEGSLYSTTKFDAYFSNDSLLHTSIDFIKIPVSPQIQYNGRIDDTLNWVAVSGSYIANGGEQFLTIGNFQDSAASNPAYIPSGFQVGGSYYYIDDVSLIEDTITGVDELSNSNFEIFPNPSTDNFKVKSMQDITGISLIDIYANTVITKRNNKITETIDVSNLADGIYFVVCEFKNGMRARKKIVVKK
jgi:Secretion system C-terminal sorting domain